MMRAEKIALSESLILTHLTKHDLARFEKAGVGYSASTGPYTEGYGGIAPYIASFLSELPRAVLALGWRKFTIHREGNSWFMRRGADTGGREAYRRGVSGAIEIIRAYKLPPSSSLVRETANELIETIARDIEAHLESAEAYADCGPARGADPGTTGAEGLAAYDALLAVMGELDRLKIADAPMSDWLTFGTMSLVESALTSRNDIGNTPAAQRDMDSLAQQAEAAATQRAPVTRDDDSSSTKD